MSALDLDDVLAIERASFPTPWSRELFENELHANPGFSYALVLEQDRWPRIIGYAVAWFIKPELHLLSLAVNPAARRRGFGRQLLASVIAVGRSLRAETLFLEVRDSNTAAQGLYRAAGFAVVGRRKGYYADTGEDGILMQLDLGEDHPLLRFALPLNIA